MGRQGIVGELEAHLVVALARGAVADRIRLFRGAISTCLFAIRGRAMEVPSR